jgi:hypothetical protein
MRRFTRLTSTLKVSKKKFYNTISKEIKENETIPKEMKEKETKIEKNTENVKTVEELRREAIEAEEILKTQAEMGTMLKKLTFRGIRFLFLKIKRKSDCPDCFCHHPIRSRVQKEKK